MASLVRIVFFSIVLIVLVHLPGHAQSSDVPKFEVGVQFSVLNVRQPTPVGICCFFIPDETFNTYWKTGFGGRVTYNFNEYFAAEATLNHFPERHVDQEFFRARPEGKIYQGQFGIKAGKRFEKVGIFVKGRPGFVGFTEVNQLEDPTPPLNFNDFRQKKETYFSLDVGGVVEFYPSRNTVLRIDAGDTIIRYGTFQAPSFIFVPPIIERDPQLRHNFQLITGFGFRF